MVSRFAWIRAVAMAYLALSCTGLQIMFQRLDGTQKCYCRCAITIPMLKERIRAKHVVDSCSRNLVGKKCQHEQKIIDNLGCLPVPAYVSEFPPTTATKKNISMKS